jgi:hypothetical protein
MEINAEVSNLIVPFLRLIKAVNDEWSNYLEKGSLDYLESQIEKYYFTNTFLHRREKVVFYDVYFPIKAEYDGNRYSFHNPEKTLSEFHYITMVGRAGCGKTTLVRHIFLQSIIRGHKIPMYIEVRNFNEFDGSFRDFILKKISNNRVKPNSRILERTLKSGAFLFILDGYDEIASSKRQGVLNDLDDFIDRYKDNEFLITTRPGAGFENVERFFQFEICALELEEISAFIDKMLPEETERANRIKLVISSGEGSSYLSYLENPLLLSMFILAFESHPEIPKRKSAFYSNVFDTLYSRHDGITKHSFPREKITGLQREDFEEILQRFSYVTFLKSQFSFTYEVMEATLDMVKKSQSLEFETSALIFDLETSISIIIKDGFEYKFPHRSLQEYFLALFISKLRTDKKSVLYQTLLNNSFDKDSGKDENLWILCEELDRYDFIEYFVIPYLEKIVYFFGGAKGEVLVCRFIEFFDQVIVRNKGAQTYFFLDRIKRNVSFIIYQNVHHEANGFIYENELTTIVDDYFSDIDEDDEELWVHLCQNGKCDETHRELYSILAKNGLEKQINDFLKKIETRIVELRSTLSQKEKSLDALLDFSG